MAEEGLEESSKASGNTTKRDLVVPPVVPSGAYQELSKADHELISKLIPGATEFQVNQFVELLIRIRQELSRTSSDT